jgi:predicted dehydrogenase
VKVAVVGLGYWGPQLVRNLQFIDACTEIVACDLDETRIKSVQRLYPSASGTSSFDALLGDAEVKAVVLATPVGTHFPLAAQALQAGKCVLVEKPLATSLKEAASLIKLAQDSGLLVMAAHTFLYSPAVRRAKQLIDEGRLGEPLYAQSSRVNLGLHQSDVSVIWDLAPHDLSILCHWFNEIPVKVSARGRASHGFGPPDVAFIDLEFPSGCIANVHLSWLAPTKVRRTTVVGSRRMLVYEDTNPEEPLKVYDKGLDIPNPEDYGEFRATYRSGDALSPRVESWEPLRAELQDFIGRVGEGQPPGPAEVAAASIVACIEAAEESLLRGGDVLDVAPFDLPT